MVWLVRHDLLAEKWFGSRVRHSLINQLYNKQKTELAGSVYVYKQEHHTHANRRWQIKNTRTYLPIYYVKYFNPSKHYHALQRTRFVARNSYVDYSTRVY